MSRILRPNEWRSDVCFECRFSPFVSTVAATVVSPRRTLRGPLPSPLLSSHPARFFPLFDRSLAPIEKHAPQRPAAARTLNTPVALLFDKKKRSEPGPVAGHRASSFLQSLSFPLVLRIQRAINESDTGSYYARSHCSPYGQRGFQETDRTITFTDLFSNLSRRAPLGFRLSSLSVSL